MEYDIEKGGEVFKLHPLSLYAWYVICRYSQDILLWLPDIQGRNL